MGSSLPRAKCVWFSINCKFYLCKKPCDSVGGLRTNAQPVFDPLKVQGYPLHVVLVRKGTVIAQFFNVLPVALCPGIGHVNMIKGLMSTTVSSKADLHWHGIIYLVTMWTGVDFMTFRE